MPELKEVTELQIVEISAVQDPAQPLALAAITKSEKQPEDSATPSGETQTSSKSEGANSTQEKESIMDEKEIELLKSKVEQLTNEVKAYKQVAALDGVQKGHYDTLNEAGKEAFIAKSADGRMEEVEKAKASKDAGLEVVYKSLSGEEFVASDDVRLVSLAKQNDELIAKQLDGELNAKVEELPNLPGGADVIKALVTAVEGISDEELRGKAYATLKSANSMASNVTKSAGHSKKPSAGQSFDSVVKSYMAANSGVSRGEAMKRVLATAEGKAAASA